MQKPPAGVDFGLQKGRGTAYETVEKRRSQGASLRFEFQLGLRLAGEGTAPDFRGPFVQGPTGARFVYIDIGTYAGQPDTCWSRRLKIPLIGITRAMIHRMEKDRRLVLEASVPGTGRDGGPNCATVKPFAGWKLKR